MKVLLDRLKDIYKERGNDFKILDIGGWFAPCKQAQYMVDIMPYETMNLKEAYGEGEMQIKPENYVQMDISSMDRLPFEDNQFDYVICRHTLEDIMNPLNVCKEMIRVAKAGYIETPSRLYESTKGVERPAWCGHYHHRWLVEIENNEISFMFKPHNMHSRKQFYFRRMPWQKFKNEYANVYLEWDGSFKYSEKVIIDLEDVKKNLSDFKKKYENTQFLRPRWVQE